MGYPKDSLNLLSLVSEYVRPCTHLHVHLAAFARELEALKQAISEDFARAEAKQVARAKSVAALEKKAAKQEAAMHATREHLWPDTTPLSATPISNQHLGRPRVRAWQYQRQWRRRSNVQACTSASCQSESCRSSWLESRA